MIYSTITIYVRFTSTLFTGAEFQLLPNILLFFGRLPERFTKDRKSSRGDVEARGHCAIVMKKRQKTPSLTLPIPSTRIFRRDMRNIHSRYPVWICHVDLSRMDKHQRAINDGRRQS